ncbi:alpha/beta fold hydrolase [Thalassolituus sp. LLYu03]|uniref:alpha/beta fold hydrolase n=1 Tax=Thalassolituus sp. LLYu03 TaxID=3421656 RepID=UPI003D2A57D5
MGTVMHQTQHALLLIHGAWAGRWVWDAIQPEFAARGLDAYAVDLPGNGTDQIPADAVNLKRYLDYLTDVAEQIPGRITLVAHSGAGVIAMALAERMPERIEALVIIAGMMLPSGMSFGDLISRLQTQHPEVSGINPYLLWNDDHSASRVPVIAARDIFFNDLDDETAISAAQKLTAQPEGGKTLVAHWSEERAGRIPRLYIEAQQDRSVVLVLQRTMQALVPGAVVVSLNAGHAPQVSMPQRVAAEIDQFLRTQVAQVA